jgi:hypothetical protein
MKPSRSFESRSWPLWLSWLTLVGALIGEHFARLPALGHQISEIAIFGVFLALLAQLVKTL